MSKLIVLLNAERTKLGLRAVSRDSRFDDLQRSPLLHLMLDDAGLRVSTVSTGDRGLLRWPASPPPPDFVPPSWWADLDGNRVVHVTQGTHATDASGLIDPTIAALAGSDVLVVGSTRSRGGVGTVPPYNVRVAPFLPHVYLLPKVDVMVANGGYNGVLAALANGVPLVCAGQTEDKSRVSARVAWSGAPGSTCGRRLLPRTNSADRWRSC